MSAESQRRDLLESIAADSAIGGLDADEFTTLVTITLPLDYLISISASVEHDLPTVVPSAIEYAVMVSAFIEEQARSNFMRLVHEKHEGAQ